MPKLNLLLRVLGLSNNQISLVEFYMTNQILCIEKVNRRFRACFIDTCVCDNSLATSRLQNSNFLNQHFDCVHNLFALQVLEENNIFTVFKSSREVLKKFLHICDSICSKQLQVGCSGFQAFFKCWNMWRYIMFRINILCSVYCRYSGNLLSSFFLR